MVKNLLDNHPALFMYPPNEFHFFMLTHFPNLGRKNKPWRAQRKPMDQIIEDVCNSKWFNPWQRPANVDWHEFVDIEKLHDGSRASQASSYPELFTDIANAMATATLLFEGNLETYRFACKGSSAGRISAGTQGVVSGPENDLCAAQPLWLAQFGDQQYAPYPQGSR